MATIQSQMGFVTVIIAHPSDSDNDQIKQIKENIREITNHVEEYTSAEKSEKFIRSSRYEYIFIIATPDTINDIFATNLHQIRHVQSIFLFDPHQKMNPLDVVNFRKSSFKMQELSSLSCDLIQCIWQCVRECANQSDILLSIFAGCSSDPMTLNVINNIADFAELWFPLYIDFLLDLPIVDPDYEQSRFVDQCRRHFSQHPGALQLLKEFEMDYAPYGAIYYYSCEAFIYHLVNRALRRQAIESIFNFRFLLYDIRNHLQSIHKEFLDKNTSIGMLKTFYRGQLMAISELEKLREKHRDGSLITTNSYFSTSESVDMARIYAGKPTADDIVSVLYEVTAKIRDPEVRQRKPFAKISQYSCFGAAEQEVLFSIGSFFKIDQIDEESPSFYIIKLTFVDEDDEKQNVIEDFRILRNCTSESKIIKIGQLLANHPSQGISKATAFYELIRTLNFSEALNAACIAGLGWLAFKEKDVVSAIEQQHEALGLYENLPRSDDDSLTHLYITSYNCIGASFRLRKQYRKALEYYQKAEKLLLKVPIDKYAMYEGYQNITSVNIACIQKLLGQVNQAWDTYKIILTHEMNSSTRFHGHTYMIIAQAGLREAKLSRSVDEYEYERCSQSWKAFLDISLTSMSSNYRRSIISGLLLIGFEYMDNEQQRTMAIDYFQKIVDISRRFVNVTRDDHRIVIQCLNQMARLHTKKRQYDRSIEHALDAFNMCHENELADIIECYESMALNYEQQLVDRADDLTPEDIRRIIIASPFYSIADSIEPTSTMILTFEGNEFSFGQYIAKPMNPMMLKTSDLQRCLAYCQLKVAALSQAQGYKDEEQTKLDDNVLLGKKARQYKKTARMLTEKVAELLIDDLQVQKICENNLNYLNEDFDLLIDTYQKDLGIRQFRLQENNLCIGEDAFSYIAHLYSRKKNVDEEHQWYRSAVQYFESHGHICKHTIMCFRKLVHFYEKHENFPAAINTLRQLANYLIKYGSCSFLRTSIEPIVMTIVQHFSEKEDSKRAIIVLQDLIDLILIEPSNDAYRINEQFKNLTSKCMDTAAAIISQVYGPYLEVILRHKPLSSNIYIHAVEPAFRQAILVYHSSTNYRKCIETYQQFIDLVINSTTDRHSIETVCKRLALEFETLQKFDVALDMYSHLGRFLIKYQEKDDYLLVGFILVRYKFLKVSGAIFTEDNQRVFIQLMIYYHNMAEPQFIFLEYFQSKYANVNRRSCDGIYIALLEFCFQYRSELYEQHMRATITALGNQPKELIAFIKVNRVNYTPLILHIFGRYGNRLAINNPSKQFLSSFEIAITNWLSSIEDDRAVYWSRLLHRLLELQSIDDEYLAICYTKMGDQKTAASLFSTDVYGDPALRYNSNACRRYLQYVYPYASAEERNALECRYEKHFFVEWDSSSGQTSFEVLSIE